MRRRYLGRAAAAALAFLFLPSLSPAQFPPSFDGQKFEDFDKLVKGAREYDGLFKLFKKDDKLYAELKSMQLDRPFLCPIAIARGLGLGGHTLNFDEQW